MVSLLFLFIHLFPSIWVGSLCSTPWGEAMKVSNSVSSIHWELLYTLVFLSLGTIEVSIFSEEKGIVPQIQNVAFGERFIWVGL